MATSDAPTPDAYVIEIQNDARRELVSNLRNLVNENLPEGFVEAMQYGMISWSVPLEVSGPTYNRQPMAIVSLANQKQAVSLYLMGIYSFEDHAAAFKASWNATGRKLDMGKACVRVKTWDDVAQEALAEALAAISVEDFLGAADTAHS